ncbi:MAG: hypothetical protein ABIN69_08730, partial [Aestuariivirga sp.]
MSGPVKSASATDEKQKLSAFAIIKDLIGTLLITLLILTPIVLVRTNLAQGSLTWSFRFELTAVLIAAVVGYRAFMHV